MTNFVETFWRAMLRHRHLLLFGMLGSLLCAPNDLRAEATAKPDSQGKAIVMENESIRLVIDPARGGAIVSFIYKPWNRDVIQRSRQYMGLFMDHLWGQNWPGELLETPYESNMVKSGPDEGVVTVWRTVSGNWGGAQQKIIRGVIIEKTYTVKAGSDVVLCHVVVRNPTSEARLPAYWCQNVFFIGGDYDATKDVLYRPSARGVRPSFQGGKQDDFLRDPTAGWSAAVDTAKGDGIVFLMNYHDLEMLYNCGGNSTLEWMYDKIPVPTGRTWETNIAMIPTAGLNSFAHASTSFIAGLESKRSGDTLFLTHRLKAPVSPVEDFSLAVKVVGAVDRKETAAAPLAIGGLRSEWKTVFQEIKTPSADPLALLVTATGQAGGKGFKEDYFYFYAGGYGYGDNVQQDLATPLFKAPRPEKKQELMRPAKIVRVREPKPQVFVIKGLHTDTYRLDESLKRFGAEIRFGAYSIGQEGPRTADFPFDYDTLLKQDVVIVSNANLQCLGKLGLMILRDYLAHGGNLLLLGGKSAYGAGGLNGSVLEDLLPVRVGASPFDLQRTGAVPIRVEKKHPAIEGLDWAALSPEPLYLHNVKIRNGGAALLSAGAEPLLVVGEVKNGGRMACLLAAPYGGQAGRPPAFFAAPGWPQFMQNLLAWLAQRDAKK